MVIEHDQLMNWRNEAIAFLALASIKGVGYWTMRSIYEKNAGFWQVIKGGTREEFEALTSVRFPPCEGQEWENFKSNLWVVGVEQWKKLGADGIGLIFAGQTEFPDTLSEIADPPYWLFVQGELLNLHCKCVAIVGTRKPSADGMFLTKLVVAALANHAMPTVSGLALGIDQIVHEESLRFNIPTIAVLGTGINENYPKGSAGVRAEIVRQGGTVITEYLPEQSYSSDNFVRRNRLQAGLCDTLIPVEWKIKSGTAHTVEFAHKYGKKIANVFLPHTYDSRPELEFAKTAYGAVACEVPQWTDLLLKFVEEDPVSILETQIELDL
jgi:DNA processing protein